MRSCPVAEIRAPLGWAVEGYAAGLTILGRKKPEFFVIATARTRIVNVFHNQDAFS